MINLTCSEDNIFKTIQGEGKYIGYPTTFIRTSGCNLRCAWSNKDDSITQCDTPHTSFDPIIEKHKIADVINIVKSLNSNHVVVTGGEPFIQKSVVKLINGLVDNGHYVTIETNGTIYKESKASFISLSPKLSSSSASEKYGEKQEKLRLNYDSLSCFTRNHNYQFKFVVNDKNDIIEIAQIVGHLITMGSNISDNIWLMPQGISNEQFDEKMQWLVEVCKSNQWKLTDRLHVRIYGAKRGV